MQEPEENYISGYVCLFRSFTTWEWFSVPNMVTIFIYCLLKANFKNKSWRGNEIKRGSFITSLDTISKDTNLSIQKIRTCLTRLEKTKEINRQTNKQFTLITVCKYEAYQGFKKLSNIQVTNDQQTTNNRLTTTNNVNNYNNDNKPYEKQDFLEDWNSLRTQHLKKPSYVKNLAGKSLQDFEDLKNDYNREDFSNAMIGLFKQKQLPNGNTTMQSNPSHFLKYFNSYLTAYHDKNEMLYGKKDMAI